MKNHAKFILTPITDLLKEAVNATAGIGDGIETYPLYDYVMQSVFLKMTGFQEQKIKCVAWELATNDYDYRRDFIKDTLGECSSYSEKQKIYKDLICQIEKRGLSFSNINIKKKDILITILSDVSDIFTNSNFSNWAQKDFFSCSVIFNEIKETHFANDNKSLFSCAKLQRIYTSHLYIQRNRIAHNTHSYQQNLPTFKTLMDEDYKYENYFLWFSILVLIDKVFIELYKKYLSVVDN